MRPTPFTTFTGDAGSRSPDLHADLHALHGDRLPTAVTS